MRLPAARAVFVPAVLVLAATCCSSSDPSTLERADEHLRELRRGRISLELRAASGPQGDGPPVGFGVDGTFDVEGGERYPLMDLAYTRVLGANRQTSAVRSDGTRVVVEVDGAERTLTEREAAPFAKSDDPSAGVTDGLGVADWVTEPTESPGEQGATRVRGQVDAAEVLGDLTVLFGDATGQRAERIDGDTADAIRAAVRDSAIDLLVDADSMLRSLTARIAFGPAVPPELERVFGNLGGVTLVLDLRVDGNEADRAG